MTPTGAVSMTIAPDPISLLSRMWLIRAFEERVSELYAAGSIGGLLHLGIGQEAIAVGTADALAADDAVFGTHRAHAHALARGADPTRLLAELAGRRTGYGGGKGGSMHIAIPEVGFVTATGVVGGGIPLALGAAYAAVVLDRPRLAVALFGDGAGQTGSFHESLNIAALWRLPVIFLCENNGYAEFTPLAAHTTIERLATHATTYAIETETVDGNDVLAVRAAVAAAAERARSGGGPQFIEALTYRLRGHYEGDPAKYRELAELADWRARDPLAVLQARLEDDGTLDRDGADIGRIEAEARTTVAAAAEAALAAAQPDASDLLSGVLAADSVRIPDA
jgi:TPP-dependent pyruvate/acetoin dehydrogenase alpha subunit